MAAEGGSTMQRALGRLRTTPPVARLGRLGRAARWHDRYMTASPAYQAEEAYLQEVRGLKVFMRQAFQALLYNGIRGDYAEFGSYGARTFTLAWGAAALAGHAAHLWSFDSFEGLPASSDTRDAHAGWTPGTMAMSESDFRQRCRDNGLPEGAFTTVPGFYADTLTPAAPGPRPDRICFAYVDCDLYSSTKQVLEFIGPRLCNGAIVAFDDYYCFSDTHPSGERLAAVEYFATHERWRLVPYIQCGWYSMSFMVEDRQTAPHAEVPW